MQTNSEETNELINWKTYLTITAESLLSFYLATFCVAIYFTHQGTQWLFLSIILVILYLFVIGVCAKRIIQTLPLQALMLIIPLAPLIALFIVISLIPILEIL